MIREVLGQSIVYGAAIILSRGILMIALLAVALFLQPADYGALIMITTIGAIVNVTVPLEVSQGLVRYHAGASGINQKIYVSTAFWFTVAMFVFFTVASEFAAEYLCTVIFGDNRYLNSLRYAVIAMSLNGIFYFIQCQFRWEFRGRDFAVVSVIHAISSLGGSIGLGLTVDPSIEGVVLGQILGASIAVLIGGWRLRANLDRVFDTSKLMEMLQFSIPLVPACISLLVVMYASRIVLNSTTTLEQVGLFGFASQIAGLAAMAIVGVQAALTPLVMARHHEPETPEKLARLFEGFTALAICSCLGLGLFARELILFFATPVYAAAAPMVLILAPAVIINQMYIFAPGLSIAKKTIWQMWISIASAGVGIVANVFLIDIWGIYGASLAALLSAISFLAMWFVVSQRLYAVPVRWRLVATGVASAVLVGVLSHFIIEQSMLISVVIKLAMLLVTIMFFCAIRLVSATDLPLMSTTLRATFRPK